MKVAIVGVKNIPGKYGGFETCVDETSRLLVKKGVDVTVYCRKEFAEERLNDYQGVKIKYVSSIKSKNISNLSATLMSALKIFFTDVKIVHIYTAGNAILIPLFRLFGRKCIISVDAIEWRRKKWGRFAAWFLRLSEKLSVLFASAVISDSKVITRYYMDNYGRNVHTIAYGANVKPYLGSSSLQKYNLLRKKYFLFVAIFRPEKNVDFLIKAFNKADTKDFILAVIGDEPNNPQYVKYILSLKTEKIFLLGRIYGRAYEEISQNAYCYVSASEIEGTSPALVAAMGYGSAVLVSNLDENLETIEDAGFSFEKNNIEDLVNKIEYLVNNPKMADESGKRLRERAEKIYSWSKVTDDLIDLYKQVQNSPRYKL
jgi:glycosyltransferase involved in cell wall biosynthesis